MDGEAESRNLPITLQALGAPFSLASLCAVRVSVFRIIQVIVRGRHTVTNDRKHGMSLLVYNYNTSQVPDF